MKRFVVAAATTLTLLTGCAQPADQPVEQHPADTVPVDAVGEDPTSQPTCDATTHGMHDHTTGRHVCPSEHGGH